MYNIRYISVGEKSCDHSKAKCSASHKLWGRQIIKMCCESKCNAEVNFGFSRLLIQYNRHVALLNEKETQFILILGYCVHVLYHHGVPADCRCVQL